MAKKPKHPKSFDKSRPRKPISKKIKDVIDDAAKPGTLAVQSGRVTVPQTKAPKRTHTPPKPNVSNTKYEGFSKETTEALESRQRTRNKNIRQTQTKRTRYEPHWEDNP